MSMGGPDDMREGGKENEKNIKMVCFGVDLVWDSPIVGWVPVY